MSEFSLSYMLLTVNATSGVADGFVVWKMENYRKSFHS